MPNDAALAHVDALAPLAYFIRDFRRNEPHAARFLAITESIGEYAFVRGRGEVIDRPAHAGPPDDRAIAWALALFDEISVQYEPARRSLMRDALHDIFAWYGAPDVDVTGQTVA